MLTWCFINIMWWLVLRVNIKFDWSKGCLCSWWILFLSMSGNLQKRLAFKLVNWVKKITLTFLNWHHPTPWEGRKEQKNKEKAHLFPLFEVKHRSSPALGYQPSWFLEFLTQTMVYIISLPIFRSLDLDWITSFLCSQPAEGRLWDFSDSKHVLQFQQETSSYTYLLTYW